MPRYIDADALMKRWSGEHAGAYFLPSEIIRSINEQPTADVPERKVGKWLKISPAGIYECSACGQVVMTGDIAAYKYCHGCGARMGGTT